MLKSRRPEVHCASRATTDQGEAVSCNSARTQSTPPVVRVDGTKREEMGWRWDADKLSRNKCGFCCYLSYPRLID